MNNDNHVDKKDNLQILINIVAALRSENGCPWDKIQTHNSLTANLIEESYELIEAIEQNNIDLIKEELGDLLLQVVFHSQIASENNNFNIYEVINNIANKMVRRHPHVFNHNQPIHSIEHLMHRWEEIKNNEKPDRPYIDIPINLPALQRAQKIGNKTAKVNFDWDNVNEVLNKINEELNELKNAINKQNTIEQEEELGDLLFTIAQLGRHLNLDSEQSLRKANRKFLNRYQQMQLLCKKNNQTFKDLTIQQKEELWLQVKTQDQIV